jgi:hypothetical protein
MYHVICVNNTKKVFEDVVRCLFHYIPGLTESNITDNRKINIIFGAHELCQRDVPTFPQNSVIVNLEQLHANSFWCIQNYLSLLSKYDVWDYSIMNQAYLKQKTNKESKLIKLGYYPLYTDIMTRTSSYNSLKPIDVLFYGGFHERRWNVYNELKLYGINVIFRNNDLWGTEKHHLINRSKIILNIHFHESKLLEYVRIFPLLSSGKFVISEESLDRKQYSNIPITFCSLDNMTNLVLHYLNNEDERLKIEQDTVQAMKSIYTRAPIKYCIYVINVSWNTGNSYYVFEDVAKGLEYLIPNSIITFKPIPGYKHIILGANVRTNHEIPQQSIIYDFEQHNDGSKHSSDSYLNILKQFECWTYSSSNVDYLKSKNINAIHVPYGYHPNYLNYNFNDTYIDTDVLFIGELNPRRMYIHDKLKRKGINVVFKTNKWYKEKHNLISRARIILNIGYYDNVHLLPVLRLFPVLNKKIIISEKCDDINDYSWLKECDEIIFCEYNEIVNYTKKMLIKECVIGKVNIPQFIIPV